MNLTEIPLRPICLGYPQDQLDLERWDVLDRETGQVLASDVEGLMARAMLTRPGAMPRCAWNRRTGEVR